MSNETVREAFEDHLRSRGVSRERMARTFAANAYDDDAIDDQWQAWKAARNSTPSAEAKDAWRPIETAPKDGTRVMVGNRYGAWMAEYRPIAQSGYRFDNPWRCMLLNRDHIRLGETPEEWGTPTHWMPIPSGPAAIAQQPKADAGLGEVSGG